MSGFGANSGTSVAAAGGQAVPPWKLGAGPAAMMGRDRA